MPVTRREFITGVGALASLGTLSPIVARAGEGLGQTTVDSSMSDLNRLVIIFQAGGNDGLNTVIPRADVGSEKRFSVYKQVRPSLHYAPDATLPLDKGADTEHQLGFHPSLKVLHRLYREGRVAIVQGVDYPSHNYSHFTSTDIWHSGRPDVNRSSGWIGRHLDRVGIPDGAIRGLAIGNELPLILEGDRRRGVQIDWLQNVRFADGTDAAAEARHAALSSFANHPSSSPLRHFAGLRAAESVALAKACQSTPPPPAPSNALVNSLLTARALLERDYGVETVYVNHRNGSYDTHVEQAAHHSAILRELDLAVEAFLLGTLNGTPIPGVGPLPKPIADRTLIVTSSEFGRRIGENGTGATAGTDHGAAGPMLILGPSSGSPSSVRLTPGLHGAHPPMGTPTLPADNLTKTTELRRVYQAILQHWLSDPDPEYEQLGPLQGLFTS